MSTTSNVTKVEYYEFLGVSRDCSDQELKTAYRRLAMQFHPDRGGSHEKMLLINEAFRILVNPAARADYDRWRANTSDPQAERDAEAAIRTAAQQAGQYPPRSEDINSWMDGLVNDFRSAEYGKQGIWPSIENSASGRGFEIEARFARKQIESEHLGVSQFSYGSRVRPPYGHRHREAAPARDRPPRDPDDFLMLL